MSDENTGLACVGLVVLALVAIVVGAVMNGWALSVLWSWFVVPIFNVPALTIPYAIGLSLVVSIFFSVPATTTKNEKKEWTEVVGALVARVLITPLFTMFLGWIVLQFVH